MPLHSLKFIAELQHQLGDKANQTNPLLIRVETKAGHGAGKPTEKRVSGAASGLGFIVHLRRHGVLKRPYFPSPQPPTD